MLYLEICAGDRARVYQINLRSEPRLEAFVESASAELAAVEAAMTAGGQAALRAAEMALEDAGARFARTADLQFVEERAHSCHN